MPAKKNTEDDGAKKEIKKSAGKSAKKKEAAPEEKKTAKAVAKKAATAAKKSAKSAAVQASSEKKAQKRASAKAPARKSAAKFAAYGGKTLVVVESPAKARTLEKILGPKYRVLASVGHVLDLPKGRLAIDLEHDFEPEYIQVRGKADLIKTLKGASAASAHTILASDPDREGEAIAWHLATLLGIEIDRRCRIRMHEITERGVKNAISKPDVINMKLVEAQQARRVLDRLVGYELSPLLWYKVQRGLSAGRVQSVALRIVCEREEEIERFIPEEYWLIDVEAESADGRQYKLRVDKYKNKACTIANEEEALKVEREIRAGTLVVDDFSTKESEREPNPPFRTSTLQQEASRRLGFAPKRTMRVAQSLYEGVDIPGRGPTGLITYMRTDSLRLAPEALEASRSFIAAAFGEKYLPERPREYAPKGRAQDAHEAIRATDASLSPESIKDHLTAEQFRLYELIWSRFIASQMRDAKVARTNLICSSADYQMKQSGAVVTFDGWGRVYPLGVKDVTMEPAVVGEELSVMEVTKEQKFTQPQPRYTEAGLVKILEEKGIGRPSTYATIIDTLSLRGYVERGEEDKRLVPTKLGRVVNDFLVRYFSSIINEGFTANMEKELDQVESGGVEWKKLVSGFWGEFKPKVDDVSENAESMRPEPEKIGESCPECGKDLVIKRGRFGEFIACSGYPECKYTRKIVKSTGIKCPKCGEGELVRRRASKGKTAGRFFYGCTRYPECDYVSWKKPGKEGTAAEQPQETNDGDM
ncbi:MAG: type I DNA topoisomerase [Synergistes jonesii]|uniref:type I DNA topoisomerase n=1 Tax=Synergistes jonesii TaxID=2754 RepID=UPI002A751253|nr:type I DNA topoisomerase [Synergistes jonesii]MDY2983982.1 type I DNA topoisomerase [Synergistes jonesii]